MSAKVKLLDLFERLIQSASPKLEPRPTCSHRHGAVEKLVLDGQNVYINGRLAGNDAVVSEDGKVTFTMLSDNRFLNGTKREIIVIPGGPKKTTDQ